MLRIPGRISSINFPLRMGAAIGLGLRQGALYAIVGFAFGFALGALRVFVIAPALGETAALWIEIPVILSASWLLCARLMRRPIFGSSPTARWAMSLAALSVLLAAEWIFGAVAFGRSLPDQFEAYRTVNGAVGLIAQIVFAAFPILRPR